MYDTYTRYLYEYIKEQFPVLLAKFDSLLAALSALQFSLDHLLQAVLYRTKSGTIPESNAI